MRVVDQVKKGQKRSSRLKEQCVSNPRGQTRNQTI